MCQSYYCMHVLKMTYYNKVISFWVRSRCGSYDHSSSWVLDHRLTTLLLFPHACSAMRLLLQLPHARPEEESKAARSHAWSASLASIQSHTGNYGPIIHSAMACEARKALMNRRWTLEYGAVRVPLALLLFWPRNTWNCSPFLCFPRSHPRVTPAPVWGRYQGEEPTHS